MGGDARRGPFDRRPAGWLWCWNAERAYARDTVGYVLEEQGFGFAVSVDHTEEVAVEDRHRLP